MERMQTVGMRRCMSGRVREKRKSEDRKKAEGKRR